MFINKFRHAAVHMKQANVSGIVYIIVRLLHDGKNVHTVLPTKKLEENIGKFGTKYFYFFL